MKSYRTKMQEYIKKILSKNEFYYPDKSCVIPTEDKELILQKLSGQKIHSNKYDLTKIFNYDTYMEMLESIHDDICCEKELVQWIKGDDNPAISEFPDINCEEAKRAFFESFHHLTTHWHKFTPRSREEDCNKQKYDDPDFTFSFFKAIYKKYPQLCVKVFPVVVFIIADSFYDFCDIVHARKNLSLPKELAPELEKEVCDFFIKIISTDNQKYYLLSLLNSKSVFYAKSSLDIGKEIYELVFNEYKKHERDIVDLFHMREFYQDYKTFVTALFSTIDHEEIYELVFNEYKKHKGDTANFSRTREFYHDFKTFVTALFSTIDNHDFHDQIIEIGTYKLKKRFEDNLAKKNKNRRSLSSTEPTEIKVGENFCAFLTFLDTMPDNLWTEGIDSRASLYAINCITGWLAFCLLYNTYPHPDPTYGLSSFPSNRLHTLYFISVQIYEELDYDESEKMHPFQACVELLLSDALKMYQAAVDELSSYDSDDICSNNFLPLDSGFIELINSYNCFEHTKLAEVFSYYILIQYACSLPDTESE